MEDFQSLSVSGLRKFLESQSISTKTLDNFSTNMVSGLAMTLLDEGEIKELVPIIGDRAILRNILKKLKLEAVSIETPISSMATVLDNHVVSGLLQHSIESNTGPSTTSTPASSVELSLASRYPSSECSTTITESDVNPQYPNTEDDFLHQGDFDDFQEVFEELDRREEIKVKPPPAKIIKTDIQDVKPKKRLSLRKAELPLPKPFEIPRNFTPNVENGLEKKSLNGKNRAKFITSIAQSIYRFKSYPTSEELDHVVQELYKKWPEFSGCLHIETHSSCISQKALQVAIRMRLAYIRKPEDSKRGNTGQSSLSRSKKVQQPKKPSIPSEIDIEESDNEMIPNVDDEEMERGNEELTEKMSEKSFDNGVDAYDGDTEYGEDETDMRMEMREESNETSYSDKGQENDMDGIEMHNDEEYDEEMEKDSDDDEEMEKDSDDEQNGRDSDDEQSEQETNSNRQNGDVQDSEETESDYSDEETESSSADEDTPSNRKKQPEVRLKWTQKIRGITPKAFTHAVGPRVPIPMSALGVFEMFFTTHILQYIVMQTNKYALECMGSEAFQSWEAVSIQELKAFTGFMILMGVTNLPSLYDYWKQDLVYHYSPIASRISRKGFLELSRYLHFADNSTLSPSGSPNYNRLGKIEHVTNLLVNKYTEIYYHNREVSVDEAMIPFKGRSAMKQYVPKKPIKRGFKVWVLADAHTGYISQLQVYTGRGEKTSDGLGANVVKTLCKNLKKKFHHVYFDNYFSSAKLLLDLLKDGIYGCGTLRSNRLGFPSDLKPKLKGLSERGEYHIQQCKSAEGNGWKHTRKQSNRLSIALWQDNRPVTVISTNSNPSESTHVTRKQKDGTLKSIPCPTSVRLYNKYMGGVDHNDQLRGYYSVRLNGRKFYKYMWWFLFDVTITNSYILCKNHSQLTVRSVKNFRTNLAKELIGEFNSRKRSGRPGPVSNPSSRFNADHFPIQMEKRSRCYRCWHNKAHKRADTPWYCKTCKKYLCHNGKKDDCFLLYHKKNNGTVAIK